MIPCNCSNDFSVWLLDDELSVLRSLEELLVDAQFSVVTFTDPLVAESQLAECSHFVVFVIDHDFSMTNSSGYAGYDFAQKARSTHRLRRAAPMIYLTARESQENFFARKALDPSNVPNIFMSKQEQARNPGILKEAVANAQNYLWDLETSIDEHGLSLAIEIATDWRF